MLKAALLLVWSVSCAILLAVVVVELTHAPALRCAQVFSGVR